MRGTGLGMVVTIVAIVTTACTVSPTAPPTSSPAPATADDHGMTSYLDGLVLVRQFRGSVEVRLDGEVLLRRGFDQADVRGEEPNKPGTRFRIASLTKQFTALAVLVLQEQDKLRVTDLLCTHLPDCPAAWRAITIEHLLTHTAGVFNYTDLTDAEVDRYRAEFGPAPTPEQLIQTFVGRPLEFPAGSRFDYSNSGYVLLGHLVERLSGQTYGEFLEDRILDPLGMSDTAYSLDEQAADAVGYRGWTELAEPFSDTLTFSSGGIRSTVTDLADWNQFLLTGEPAVVRPDTLAQLLRPRVALGDEHYGYGIQTRGTGEVTTHFHDGGVDGFATFSQIQPATGLSIVVLGNLDTVDADGIAGNLAALATT